MFLEDRLLRCADPLPMSIIREECLSKETYLVIDNSSNYSVAFFTMGERLSSYLDVETHTLYSAE